jgi:uncharacterized membrane protein YkoI
MKRTTRLAIVAAATVALAGGVGVAAVAANGGGDDDEQEVPITGAELEQASAAALASTGGGTVTGTEVGDEDSYYEVEVTLDDGSQVDVQLDRDFNVVASEADSEDDAGDTDD